jgi:phosphoenolpyruvate synthase/pyruvate phosphate dikinase
MFFLGNQNEEGGLKLEVGAKAFHLHLLKRKQYPVPPGFVLGPGSPMGSPVSRGVEQMGGFPVAVRSSGQLEDMEGASFAGQYETFLNVSSEEALNNCIQACFESANHPRVKTYLQSRNLRCDEGDGRRQISVIVQKMVDVRYAGVAFSLDPMDGKEENFVLEVCAGVGERLVSGHTSPSRYAVNFEAVKVVSYDPGEERIQLSPRQLEEIRDYLLNIQSDFESPQDVEWAIDQNGRFWILQTRPITYVKWRIDLGEYTNADFKDGGISSSVCTPMMFSLYDRCFSESMDRYLSALRLIKPHTQRGWMTHQYGRAYWNVGIIKRALFKIPGFHERNLDMDLGIEKDYGALGPHVTPVNLKTLVRAVPILIGLKREYSRCRRMVERFKGEFEGRDQKVLAEVEKFKAYSHDQFSSKLEEMTLSYYIHTETSYFRSLYNNSNYQSDFKKFIEKMDQDIGGTTPLLELMLGLNEISHLEIQEGMVGLLKVAKAHSRQSAQWQKAFQHFIRRYYFHGDTALDLKTPRWGETPEILIERVDSMLKTGVEPCDPEKMKIAQRKRYLQAYHEVLNRIEKSSFRARRKYRAAFPAAVEQLRYFMVNKEKMREFSTRSYYVVRQYLLEAERRLRGLGVLGERDDIFFLHIGELLDLAKNWRTLEKDPIQKRIVYRRKMYQSFRKFTPPNEFGQKLVEKNEERLRGFLKGEGQLKGIACSPGVYEGLARIIKDLSEVEKIKPGEVLVTKFTDPAWTPVLGIVSAVVTEVGGVLSHAAVISREYGIPAVLNSKHATEIIQNGQRIRVDGDRGIILLM